MQNSKPLTKSETIRDINSNYFKLPNDFKQTAPAFLTYHNKPDPPCTNPAGAAIC